MSSIEVRELGEAELDEWDALVARAPWGTIFHGSRWVIENARGFGFDPVFFGCFLHDRMIGGCPVYARRLKSLFPIAGTTTPMSPYGGPVLEFSESNKKSPFSRLSQTIDALNSTLLDRYVSVNLVNSPKMVDIRPFIWQGWTPEVYYTHEVTPEKFTPTHKVQKLLKRALEAGIAVEEQYDIDRYFALLSESYDRQGLVPPVTKDHFRRLCDTMFDEGRAVMVFSTTPEGETASGEVVLVDRDQVHCWSAAADRVLRTTGAPLLTTDATFRLAQDRGLSKVNMMGGNMKNLIEYYEMYRPNLVPYFGVRRRTALHHIPGRIIRYQRRTS
jgi:hypothetical protein